MRFFIQPTNPLRSVHRKELYTLLKALLTRATLDEHQILEDSGLPPAPALATGHLAVAGADRRSAVTH